MTNTCTQHGVTVKNIDPKGFFKSPYYDIVTKGVAPQTEETCDTCSKKVTKMTTESADYGIINYKPAECDNCRNTAYLAYIHEQKEQDYQRLSHKCCGYQNKCVKQDNIYVEWDDIRDSYKHQSSLLSYIERVINGEEGRGAFIQGSLGTGKTFLSKILNNALVQQRRNTCFVKMNDLSITLRKETFGNQYKAVINEFRNVKTLIIDDYGTQKTTEWVSETLYSILDNRYENRMQTIFTTNTNWEIIKKYNQRLASRLADPSWLININLLGKDIRREPAKLNF